MTTPLLTIGMPTCYDYSGALLSVIALKEYQSFIDGDIEILVVDNTPENSYRDALKRQILGMNSPKIRYMEFTEERGPAESKNQVFENATGEYVICMDSHVMFNAGSISRLKDFLKSLPEKNKDDFFTGPLKGNEGGYSTHFRDIWRGEMWGIWGTDKELLKTDEIKPIWAQGCGLILTRRESWLGFNKNFKGFGGEEGYIHEKYRKAGREVYLVPWLGWWHRFGNPDTKHYNLTRYSKVRNYVLGHQELGMPLDNIYNHFVSLEVPNGEELAKHLVEEHSVKPEEVNNKTAKELLGIHQRYKLSKKQWERILENPEENEHLLEDITEGEYIKQVSNPSNDLNEHFPIMQFYSEQCDSVAEITRRGDSCLPLLTSKAKEFKSYIFESKPNIIAIKDKKYNGTPVDSFDTGMSLFIEGPETDLIFLKYPHTYETTSESLKKIAKKVTKYIIIHDTEMNYRPDITKAMKDLVATGEWHVRSHINKLWGLTILSREIPDHFSLAWLPDPGVGAEVKKLLAKMGIEAQPNCSCNRHAYEMDHRGPDWCEENIETIVDWLKEQAHLRKMPFVRIAGRLLVKRAIRNTRKGIKHGS